MTRCIQFPFIVLLVVWRNQSILGSDVDLVVSDATCVGNNVTLKCTINPFTTVPSATWSRNGSNALTTCTSGGPCTQDDLTIDGVKYSFTGGSSGIQVAFQITVVENDIEWICSHNATPYRYTFNVLSTCVVTTEGTTEGVGNYLCDGCWKAYLLMISCSVTLPIVKILIILWLWKDIYYKRKPDTVIPLKPICKNCRIAVTAQKTLKSAAWKIQKKDQQPIPYLKNGYTIDVCEGQLLECMFATDAGVLELSFQYKDDLLHVEPYQTITLPTLLKVNPMFSTVKWRLNGRLIPNVELQFITKVTSSTCGVYDIEMKFKEHKIIIWIQNIIVKESTEDEGDSTSWPLWLRLLIICVFVDLIFAVLGGSITWWKSSTDGFCVEEKVIIIIVVVSFVVFTIVEIALIWFLMIKRTGDEKGSRSKKTVNAMAAAETGAMSASNGDPKTSKNQNGPNWQPPNNKDPNDASQ